MDLFDFLKEKKEEEKDKLPEFKKRILEERDRILRIYKLSKLKWKKGEVPPLLKQILKESIQWEEDGELKLLSAELDTSLLEKELPILQSVLNLSGQSALEFVGAKVKKDETTYLVGFVESKKNHTIPFINGELIRPKIALCIPLKIGKETVLPFIYLTSELSISENEKIPHLNISGLIDLKRPTALELKIGAKQSVDSKFIADVFGNLGIDFGSLPLGLSKLTHFELSRFQCNLRVPTKDQRSFLEQISFEIQQKKTLQIWDDKIVLNDFSWLLDSGNLQKKDESPKLQVNSKLSAFNSSSQISFEPTAGKIEFQLSDFKLQQMVYDLTNGTLVLPDCLKNSTVDRFDFDYDFKKNQTKLSCAANSSFFIHELGLDCDIAVAIQIEKLKEKYLGKIDGKLHLGDFAFKIDVVLGENSKTLNANIQKLQIKEVVEKLLKIEYPEFLPNTKVEVLDLKVKEGETLSISTTITDNQGLHLKDSHLQLSQLDFNYQRVKEEKGLTTEAEIKIKSGLNVENAITFKNLDFDLEYKQDKEGKSQWKAATADKNGIKASVFGHEMLLSLAYEHTDKKQILLLDWNSPFPTIGIPDVIDFTLDQLTFSIEKEEKSTQLNLMAKSSLSTDFFEYKNLEASLYHKGIKTGLTIKPIGGKDNHCYLKLAEGDLFPYLSINDPKLSVIYDSEKKKWESKGDALFKMENVPDILKKVFPSQELKGRFEFTEKVAEIGLQYEGGYTIPLPPKIEGMDTEQLNLGNLYFGLSEMKINLKNGGKLTSTVVAGLPQELNDLFTESNGTKHELFRTYNPKEKDDKKREEGLIKFNLSFDKSGIFLEMGNSPFKDIIKIKDNRVDLDLGEFGALAFSLPTLKLEGKGSIKANMELEVTRDLKLPLTPLKLILKQVGLDDIADNLANAVPLKGVNFAPKDEHGNRQFDSTAFIKLFTLDGKVLEVPEEIKQGISQLNQFVSRLPNNLLEYAELETPNYLYLDLDINATQSVNFTFSSRKEGSDEVKPIKLIFPGDPYCTQLVGIQLNGVSIGELFGGNLFRMDLDLVYDVFNLPDLIAALVINPEWDVSKKYLPNPKHFSSRFVFQEVVFLIIYQTQIPIPIPVFYKKIGVSYLNVLGTELETSFSFPMPVLGLQTAKDIAIIGSEVVQFIKNIKNNPKVNIEKLEKIDFPSFTVGANYIRTPKYISREKEATEGIREGSLIGIKEGFEINAKDIFCAFLNAIQERSINALLKAIPLQRRLGKFELSLFDVLDVETKYALTTPKEFSDVAYKELEIEEQEARHYLASLPQASSDDLTTEDTEGVVMFMNGMVQLKSVIDLNAGLGFIASKHGLGLGGKFKLELMQFGNLPPLIDLNAGGVFMMGKTIIEEDDIEEIKPVEENDFGVVWSGYGSLSMLGINLSRGKFKFSDRGVYLEAKVGDKALPFEFNTVLSGSVSNELIDVSSSTDFRILGFQSTGSLAIFANHEKAYFKANGSTNFFGSTFETGILSQADQKEAALLVYMKGNILELASLNLEGLLYLNQQAIGAKGKGSITLLDTKLVSLNYEYENDTIRLNDCSISLFSEEVKHLIELKGNASGELSPQKLELKGKLSGSICGYTISETTTDISHKEFIMKGKLFGNSFLMQLDSNSTSYSFDGSMEAIAVGPLLLSGTKEFDPNVLPVLQGPKVSVSEKHFFLDARASLFGVSNAVKVNLFGDSFQIDLEGKFLGVTAGKLKISGTNLTASAALRMQGEIEVEAFVSKVEEELIAVAGNIVSSLQDARDKVEVAKEKAFKAARAVQNDLESHLHALTEKYSEAQVAVNAAQKEVSKLKATVKDLDNQIKRLHQEIKNKEDWAKNSSIFVRAWRWIEFGAFAADRGIRIGALEGSKKVMEGLLLGANLALDLANKSLDGLKDINKIAEKAIDIALIELKHTTDEFLSAAEEGLEHLSHEVGKYEEWAKEITAFRKELLSIHRIHFDRSIDQMKNNLLVNAEVSVMGTRKEYTAAIDFSDTKTFVASLVQSIRLDKPSPRAICAAAHEKGDSAISVVKQLFDSYPDLDAIQIALAMKRGGYAMLNIGEGMRYYQDTKDKRKQLVVKALRIAQEEE